MTVNSGYSRGVYVTRPVQRAKISVSFGESVGDASMTLSSVRWAGEIDSPSICLSVTKSTSVGLVTVWAPGSGQMPSHGGRRALASGWSTFLARTLRGSASWGGVDRGRAYLGDGLGDQRAPVVGRGPVKASWRER